METFARILVVDDEIGMREGCRRALSPHGLHVVTAEHGAEGLRKLREEPFDLILLDAMMPGISGLELLGRIQEHDPDIICIMITGYATVDLAARAMKEGAYDFLPKPFTAEELLTIVQEGLQERQQRQAQKLQQEKAESAHQMKRARQEQAKFDAIESRFMLVVVHELRNPAGVIKNYLQLMRSGFVEEDEWDEYLERLDLRASQLLHMLDDLLELARLKELSSATRVDRVEIAGVLEQVVDQMRSAAEAKGVELEVEVLAHPIVAGESSHLQSLWSNLVDNAIKYTPEGRVHVRLDEQDGQMVGAVTDTGIGMSTEDLSRIFGEFFRSEAAREEVVLGTGLGLAIVNQIVKLYGGTIEVDSTLGEGSTFTITLPVTGPASKDNLSLR
jgi:signal transduction histidine kinase